MFALTPRHIGAKLNLDEIQFFVDFCNSQILNSDPYKSVLLPQFKAIVASMEVEIRHPHPPHEFTKRVIDLQPTDRSFVEKFFYTQGWFTLFTTRKFMVDSLPQLNVESVEILTKIIESLPEDHTGAIFVLSTVRFDTPENSQVPKPLTEEELEAKLLIDKDRADREP